MSVLQEEVEMLRKRLAEKEAVIEQQKIEEKEKQSWKFNFDILKNIYVGHVINIRRIKEKYNKPICCHNRWDNLLLHGTEEDFVQYNKLQVQQKNEVKQKREKQEQDRKFYVHQYRDKHNFNYHEALFKCLQCLDDHLNRIEQGTKCMQYNIQYPGPKGDNHKPPYFQYSDPKESNCVNGRYF